MDGSALHSKFRSATVIYFIFPSRIFMSVNLGDKLRRTNHFSQCVLVGLDARASPLLTWPLTSSPPARPSHTPNTRGVLSHASRGVTVL